MNFLEKILLSENKSQHRKLEVSASSDTDVQIINEETYLFVNKRKRNTIEFKETNLNLNDSVEILRDVHELPRDGNLSPLQKNDIFFKLLSPENKRIEFHSESDKIQTLLQNDLKEKSNLNSEIELSTNASQNKSTEIIMKKLKSLENAINQEAKKEEGTINHVENLFPIFLKSSDSGNELYTRKKIYLKDAWNKMQKSKKSSASVAKKDHSIAEIHYHSGERINSNENFSPDGRTKIPKFEIRCHACQKKIDEIAHEDSVLLTKKNIMQNKNIVPLEESILQENVSDESFENEKILQNDESNVVLLTKKNIMQNKNTVALEESILEENVSDKSFESEKVLKNEESNVVLLTKKNIMQNKNTVALEESILEENVSEESFESEKSLQNEESNIVLLTKENIMQNKNTVTLEESILEENVRDESFECEKSLQNEESNVENEEEIIHNNRELGTIFEDFTEDRNSSLQETSQEMKKKTSRSIGEITVSRGQKISNSIILGNVIVNDTLSKKNIIFPLEIDAEDESSLEITLQIKLLKSDYNNNNNA